MRNIPSSYIKIENVKTCQKLLVYTLKQFDSICNENGLIYNIFGGTLLGAVRHHGMIPWDNDIDVTMPRPDYEQFIQLIKTKYNSRYKVYAYPDPDYGFPFAKFTLRGTLLFEKANKKYEKLRLYVDVFPVDGYPDKAHEQKYFNQLRKLKNIRTLGLYKFNHEPGIKGDVRYAAKCVVNTLAGELLVRPVIRQEIKIAKTYSYETSDILLQQGNGWNEKGIIPKSVYLNRKRYEFDGIEVWGIADYNDNLKNFYGDYMTLPPVEDRAVHSFELYVDKRLLRHLSEKEGIQW